MENTVLVFKIKMFPLSLAMFWKAKKYTENVPKIQRGGSTKRTYKLQLYLAKSRTPDLLPVPSPPPVLFLPRNLWKIEKTFGQK
jgi:hypothetical protein